MIRFLGWMGFLFLIPSILICQHLHVESVEQTSLRTALLHGTSLPLNPHTAAFAIRQDSTAEIIWRPGDVPTIATQVGLGAVSLVVFGVASGLVGTMAVGGNLVDGANTTDSQLAAVWIVTGLGASLGLTQGVMWGGDIWNGNGDYWSTLLGAVLGIAAGGILGATTEDAAGWAFGSTLALATPILFYHLTASDVHAGPSRSWTMSKQFQPTGGGLHYQVEVLRVPLKW
jgi:hypothetical protein